MLNELHPEYRTPWLSVVLNVLAVGMCLTFDFAFLVQIDVTLNSLNLLLGDLALIWLRIKEPPDVLHRPYQIPFDTLGLIVFMFPHMALCTYLGLMIDHEAQVLPMYCLSLE